MCTECWHVEHAFEAALSVGVFDAPLTRAVVLHKDAGERRLAAVLAALVGARISEAWPEWAERIAYVPASPSAVTRRGFDHGRAIAVEVAQNLGLELCDALRVGRARDQRALGRAARARNVAGAFSAVSPVCGRVLLVDDVMTTGATADAAAEALLDAGADAVRVATVARVW